LTLQCALLLASAHLHEGQKSEAAAALSFHTHSVMPPPIEAMISYLKAKCLQESVWHKIKRKGIFQMLLLFPQGKFSCAIQLLKHALLVDSSFLWPLYTLSLVYQKQGLVDAQVNALNVLCQVSFFLYHYTHNAISTS
jgi:hypothetical protein